MPRRKKVQRAPYLMNREPRKQLSNKLPEDVKAMLYDMARAEGKSYSWMMEQAIIRYFRMPRPVYYKKVEK